MLIFLLLLNVFSSLHKCVVNSLSFLVSVMLRINVSLCFWATVSALVCLVCSSSAVRNDDKCYGSDGCKLQVSFFSAQTLLVGHLTRNITLNLAQSSAVALGSSS